MVAAGEDVEPPLARGMSDADIMVFTDQQLHTGVSTHTVYQAGCEGDNQSFSCFFFSGVERQDGAAINRRVYRDRYGGQVTKKRCMKERS